MKVPFIFSFLGIRFKTWVVKRMEDDVYDPLMDEDDEDSEDEI